MNTAAVLALIGDLYAQIAQLRDENLALAAKCDDLLHLADQAPEA